MRRTGSGTRRQLGLERLCLLRRLRLLAGFQADQAVLFRGCLERCRSLCGSLQRRWRSHLFGDWRFMLDWLEQQRQLASGRGYEMRSGLLVAAELSCLVIFVLIIVWVIGPIR